MSELQQVLGLPRLPRIIEGFDISNISGTLSVASMVRFADGLPDKDHYRHFCVKTVIGSDDFASIAEIVGRRYRRLLDEKALLPDVILIDGGKGQLSAATAVLQSLDWPISPCLAWRSNRRRFSCRAATTRSSCPTMLPRCT